MMARIAGGRAAALVLALSLLSACGQIVPPAKQQKPLVAANAISIGVRRGPPLSGLTIPL